LRLAIDNDAYTRRPVNVRRRRDVDGGEPVQHLERLALVAAPPVVFSRKVVVHPSPRKLLKLRIEPRSTRFPSTYAYEWFDPSTHSVIQTGTIRVGARHTFTAPLEEDAVLWLHQ
jgi:hypothetical protein